MGTPRFRLCFRWLIVHFADFSIPFISLTAIQITTFLQSLLDTSFLNLIQTPSAHRILKKIQAQIDPEIKHIERTEQLRGPLDPFVRAQAKAAREAKAISEGGKAPVADWRQRKKLAHAQAGMIGLYQLEELTLWGYYICVHYSWYKKTLPETN